ncbi:MAG: cysteine--tRNA ligase [Bdellovibrionota bacterium]
MKIHNTLTGKLEEFVTIVPKKVSMYVCGPTVYDDSHIGHGRTYISYDMISRYLRYKGYDVTYVRNITDIDDKIITKANQEKTTINEITKRYAASFHNDLKTLGLNPPDIEPTATGTVKEMIEMIETLIQRKHAYASGGDVYFDVKSFEGYGKLSKKNIEDLQVGARVMPGEQKKDPLDFALWKAAKEGEPAWDSPWGKGRPGWHIECSAMSKKHLGETIDIHTGGRDLIFPHHENEIAQSECVSGKTFAKYWLHNGFVNLSKEKCSSLWAIRFFEGSI